MTKTTPPRLDPADLAELLDRTRQDVKRYRRLHPEWCRPVDGPAPVQPDKASTAPAKPPASPENSGHH